MELIDKSAIVAEIERKIRTEQGYSSGDAECGYRDCARDILSFINTLEVKDIEDMLEDAAEDAKDEAFRDIAWKVHVMISDGKSLSEIDHYVTGICDF